MEWAVEEVLRAVWPAHARERPVEKRVRRAMWRLMRCGTGDLGTYVRRCPAGHFAEAGARSCRHRSCPKCRGRKVYEWLEGWKERLLPGTHFHCVFTLPSEFHPLWRRNRKAMANLLFASARETLIELLADPRYLGALPGVLMVLHTWSRALALHPHVHCLVTGGGVDERGRWKKARRGQNFLLPWEELQREFQQRFPQALEQAWAGGTIELPEDWTEGTMRETLGAVAAKRWCVRIEPPYQHGTGLVVYLARYVCGGPIGAKRIKDFDGEHIEIVTGREEQNPATARLTAEEFIQRWSEHIPEPGLRMARACGLYSTSKEELREQCRAEIAGAPPPERTGTIETPPMRCPVCERELVIEICEAPRYRRRRGPPRFPQPHAEAA
jgi:hypothetical protein